MIKDYGVLVHMSEERDYQWVDYADYLALQAALREALDGWEYAMNRACSNHTLKMYEERIAELRTQFLDEKWEAENG